MPYPAEVDTGFVAITPAWADFNVGPFLNGTNLFTILDGDPTNSISLSAWKSTDQGLTWTNMDTTNEPRPVHVSGFQSTQWSIVQNGTLLYTIGYVIPAATITLALFAFDMAAGTWSNTGSPLGTITAAQANSTAITNISGYREPTEHLGQPCYRSDNTIVQPYIGLEVVAGTQFVRSFFAVCGSAGAFTLTDSNCGEAGASHSDLLVGAVLGSSNRTHIFYIDYSTKHLVSKTITSGNVVTGSSVLATDLFDPAGVGSLGQVLSQSVGMATYDSGSNNIVVPYKDTNNHAKVAIGTSADTVTWTTTQVDTTVNLWRSGTNGTNPFFTGNVLAAAYLGTTGTLSVLFWSNNYGTNTASRFGPTTLYQATNSGTTWLTPTALYTDTGFGGTNGGERIECISPIWSTSTAFNNGPGVIIYDSANLDVCYWQPGGTAPVVIRGYVGHLNLTL